jgi:hypothetical protein
VFACDSTGFREDVEGFYYALRNGRRWWIKDDSTAIFPFLLLYQITQAVLQRFFPIAISVAMKNKRARNIT